MPVGAKPGMPFTKLLLEARLIQALTNTNNMLKDSLASLQKKRAPQGFVCNRPSPGVREELAELSPFFEQAFLRRHVQLSCFKFSLCGRRSESPSSYSHPRLGQIAI